MKKYQFYVDIQIKISKNILRSIKTSKESDTEVSLSEQIREQKTVGQLHQEWRKVRSLNEKKKVTVFFLLMTGDGDLKWKRA